VTSGGLEPGIDRLAQRFAQRLDSLKPVLITFERRHYPDDIAVWVFRQNVDLYPGSAEETQGT